MVVGRKQAVFSRGLPRQNPYALNTSCFEWATWPMFAESAWQSPRGKRRRPHAIRLQSTYARGRYHWARTSVQRDPSSRSHYHWLRQVGHNHGRALRGVCDPMITFLMAILRSGKAYNPDLRRGSFLLDCGPGKLRVFAADLRASYSGLTRQHRQCCAAVAKSRAPTWAVESNQIFGNRVYVKCTQFGGHRGLPVPTSSIQRSSEIVCNRIGQCRYY